MKTIYEKFQMFADSSHALLVPEFAQEIAGYFGKDCSGLVDIFETSTEPKGYHGPTGDGVPAFQLSVWLCEQLGLEYQNFFGRGTQHRHCCDILRNRLNHL